MIFFPINIVPYAIAPFFAIKFEIFTNPPTWVDGKLNNTQKNDSIGFIQVHSIPFD